jgi:hypothetical protein
MGKFYLASAYGVALVLWLGVACGKTDAQTTKTGGSNSRGSHKVVSCKKDSQCPSGQRCGFTSGCESKGKCVLPSGNASCIDPGGRCGCDGRPVDIFCAVGSRTEFTSAPVDSVGPCPRPCTKEVGCGSRLVCRAAKSVPENPRRVTPPSGFRPNSDNFSSVPCRRCELM